MVGLILNNQISPRGDMNSYAENFAHEDYFMQQARANGQEIGAADPTAAVGNFLKFAVNLVNAKAVVEIGTGSGVGGLWLLSGMSSEAVLTTIDSEREHSKISRTVFEDADIDAAIEGALMFALNQGEICTTPSRILVHESIADLFIERMQARLKLIKAGNPLDPETMIGSQVSKAQCDKIVNYINIGKEEGAVVLAGGEAGNYEGDLAGGYYVQPTVLKGTNNMRVFQEEIFGPVVALTTFKTTEEAIAIANDTPYGLGAGVWSRDAHELFQVPRAIKAGRVWVNQYNTYPAHAPFGGVKESGFGRENHKMALDHYRVVKNMLISYDKEPVGFF